MPNYRGLCWTHIAASHLLKPNGIWPFIPALSLILKDHS